MVQERVVDMVNIQLIEQKRLEHGYNQEQLARLMGYESHTAYYCKVKGKRQFSIEDIVKICKLFQLELNDVIMM